VADAEALARARDVDYARGRQEYFKQRSGEPVKGTGPMKTESAPTSFLEGALVASLSDGFLLAQGSGNYTNPEERTAYRRGYDEGYARGLRSGYDSYYRDAYDRAWPRGRDDGRREADRRDYSGDRQRGYDQGYREQFDSTYASFRASAFKLARAEESARVSTETYSQRYQGYYDAAFTRLKQEAYQARYKELLTSAREAARTQTMAQKYPEYAKAEFQRGRVEEKADLAARPLRIVTASFTTPGGGPVTATGQPAQLNLSVRNFGETKYGPGAMTFEIVPTVAGSAFLPLQRLTVSRDFPANVVLAGRGLAELQVRREFAGQDLEFEIRVLLEGRPMDTRTLKLNVSESAPPTPPESPEPVPSP
jgi:hypothetical protein